MKKVVIDEAFLAQLEQIETILKNNVAGMFGGNRRSKSFGSSCEFADYRDYMPGDDVTKIDWNAYARFDKLYEKLYFDERQMHTKIYIDTSRSMIHGDEEKAAAAIRLAAAFAYLSVSEMDKVSIYAIRGAELIEVASGMVGKDSYLNLIGRLNQIEFDLDSKISEAIVPSAVGRGDGYSILISDFLTDDNYEAAIDRFAEQKRDILCVQILSREEINPQMRGKMHLFDSENPVKFFRKKIDADVVRAYKDALKYVTDRIRQYCESRGGQYIFAPAYTEFAELFFDKFVDMGVVK
jgi:uncharacterized protein (DUF58 family)